MGEWRWESGGLVFAVEYESGEGWWSVRWEFGGTMIFPSEMAGK